MTYMVHSSSYIVATSFFLRTTGSWSSHAYSTLPPLVCPKSPRRSVTILVAKLVDTVTGIMNTYYYSALPFLLSPAEEKTGVAYFPICLSLNVLLTLMIITRLVLHKRNIRHSMGTSDGTSKLYTTIIIMFIESYALYAIAFISYIISSTLGASVSTVFSRLLGGIQVSTTRSSLDMS